MVVGSEWSASPFGHFRPRKRTHCIIKSELAFTVLKVIHPCCDMDSIVHITTGTGIWMGARTDLVALQNITFCRISIYLKCGRTSGMQAEKYLEVFVLQ